MDFGELFDFVTVVAVYTLILLRPILFHRGIFIFKEIIGRDRILWWLASASVAVAGILWLSYEHA